MSLDQATRTGGERLLRGERNWWFLGAGGIVRLGSRHVTPDGTLLPETERWLDERGMYATRPVRSYALTVLTSTHCNLGCGYCFLDQLSDGALDWLGGSLDHFDPYSSSAPSATHAKAKAALEMALLCHCAARLDGSPAPLTGARDLVRTLWGRPDFPDLFDVHPKHASSYGLIYTALAPAGVDGTSLRLDPGFLSPHGKSPYERIEIRYYADKAGVPHGIEPYAGLVPLSPLVAYQPPAPKDTAPEDADAAPLPTPQAYALTHTAFYLGDFGRTRPGLTAGAAAGAKDLVRRMLDHCVAHDRWDLAAELLLTQFILGTDPLRTPSGAAAVECLVKAQQSDGAVPGRSATLRATESDTAAEFFRRAYHTTLVTALMALIISSGRAS